MLDTARLPVCHDGPQYRLSNVLHRERDAREAGLSLMTSAMPDAGATMALDVIVDMLSTTCPDPYDVVSHSVRETLFVVEFEAVPHPFPFRGILVRRL